ncbi:hypothetical protein Tco_0088584 [Tanacetum coccineum]
METRVMEKTSYLTTTTLITTTDKHGVPPTKRLFRVAMLDPSQGFIDPWGKFGDLELPRNTLVMVKRAIPTDFSLPEKNLLIWKLKRRTPITDVENTVFDLRSWSLLCFGALRSKSLIGMITKPVGFVLNSIGRWACFSIHKLVRVHPMGGFGKLCGAHSASSSFVLTRRHCFHPMVPFKILFKPRLILPLAHVVLGDNLWRDAPNLAKRDFRICKLSASFVGSVCFKPILTNSHCHEKDTCSLVKTERAHKVDAPYSKIHKLWMEFEQLITLNMTIFHTGFPIWTDEAAARVLVAPLVSITFEVKFFEEENPSGILALHPFCKEILKRTCPYAYALFMMGRKLFPYVAPKLHYAKSLASHISSYGRSQFRAFKMELPRLSFNVLEARMQSSKR